MEITNKQVLKIFDSSYDAMKVRIRLFFFFYVEANTQDMESKSTSNKECQ